MPPSERTIVFTIGAVQFVNILDFIIVMPLGPDFARALGIPMSHIGYVGGSYTAAAGAAGIAGAFFLDRFDRKKALVFALFGLVVGTLGAAFAVGLHSLMLARVFAGAFGGPATALAYSIIADVIPIERRGKAMGAVMGAFSLASILGVPAGLELARRGTWNLPFIGVAILGALLCVFTYAVLPPMAGHLEVRANRQTAWEELRGLMRGDTLTALATMALTTSATFIVVPNISTYLIGNLHYPRARLALLYLVGGSVSFVSMRLVGRLVDRYGSAPIGGIGVALAAFFTYTGFIMFPPPIPVMVVFVGWMIAMAFRNVAQNALMSKVPRPDERARFGSLQSASQHVAASLAAFTSAHLLSERPDGGLEGIPVVATVSMVLASSIVPLFFLVEARVKRLS